MTTIASAWRAGLAAALVFFVTATAHAAPIIISGQLGFLSPDLPNTGVFGNSPAGATFTGTIDDMSFNGSLSDGTTTQVFTCCIAAGGLGIEDQREIDQEEADFANSLQSDRVFVAGEVFDGVDIEGDVFTPSGGRIEIGISYLFPEDTFDMFDEIDPVDFYTTDISTNVLPLFFIFEEDADGQALFSGVGLNVPLPATLALFPAGLIAGIGWMRRRTTRA